MTAAMNDWQIEADTILKLIKEVDPADTAKLNEIDARIWCYLEDDQYCGIREFGRAFCYRDSRDQSLYIIPFADISRFTRSRDAIKCLRPDGWEPRLSSKSKIAGMLFTFELGHFEYDAVGGEDRFKSEELAELDATIRAIAVERNAKAFRGALERGAEDRVVELAPFRLRRMTEQ